MGIGVGTGAAAGVGVGTAVGVADVHATITRHTRTTRDTIGMYQLLDDKIAPFRFSNSHNE